MPEEVGWTLTRVIFAVVVIVVIAAIAFIFFREVYPLLRGEEPKPEEQERAESNFDLFVANIEACKGFGATDCLCEGLPAWPAAFPARSILTIKSVGTRAEINLTYGGKVLKNATVEGVRFSAMGLDKKKVSYYAEKRLDFKHEPPYYEQADIGGYWHFDKLVLNPYLYKTGDGLYFFIGSAQEARAEEREKTVEKIVKCAGA